MNYRVDEQNCGIAETMRIISNFGVVYRSVCVGRSCDECYTDRDLYRVCPGCGGKLLVETTLPYMCSCGTVIWTCGFTDGKFVTIYAVSSLLLEIEEDTI